MKQLLNEIRSHTNIILDEGSPADSLAYAVEGLRQCFSLLTDTEGNNRLTYIGDRITEAGVAIDPVSALNCVSDVPRTVKYIRGIRRALDKLRSLLPDSMLNVVYAGCGPFASLLMPLVTLMKQEKIKIFLLDINNESLENVRVLVNGLELPEEMFEYINADAANYKFGSQVPLHLLISETMCSALNKEPQISVTINLASQLCDIGIVIPEQIIVRAFLADPAVEFYGRSEKTAAPNEIAKNRKELGEVFTLSMESARKLSAGSQTFRTAELRMPADVRNDEKLILSTVIKVIDDIIINEYESGLTNPFIYNGDYPMKPGAALRFYYHISGYPRFVIS